MVSLIDVMMLLLVIFMITAPLMQGGVDVKLPVADARPLDDKSSLVISIQRNGRIFIDRDSMTFREFQGSFKSIVGSRTAKGVTVRADGRGNVELLIQVLAVVRNAGVTNVGIATEEAPK